jgi:hypothetical protein
LNPKKATIEAVVTRCSGKITTFLGGLQRLRLLSEKMKPLLIKRR